MTTAGEATALPRTRARQMEAPAFDDAIFCDEMAARRHLEALRWPDGPVCPHCASRRALKIDSPTARPGVQMCRDCRRQFTVTVGTIMESSKVPLTKWLIALAFMNRSTKRINAAQLQRLLGITYKSAWFLAYRLRALAGDYGPPREPPPGSSRRGARQALEV